MNNPVKIALIDDEILFLEGLSLLLSSQKNIRVAATSTSGLGFLERLKKISQEDFPNIALLDIQMKPMDGFELVGQLKKEHPSLKIIILSSHYKNAMFGHMIRLGVSAFLPKNAGQDMLVDAINKVHKSGVFFSQKDYEMLALFVKNKSQKRYFDSSGELSEREIEVLQFICSEHTNQEIAEKLYLSMRTVESHRQRILVKTGAKNTAGLVIYAISHEIYSPESRYYY